MAINPLAKLTGTKLRICIFIASTIGFVLFGYDNGVFSGLIVNPWFLSTFNDPQPSLLGTVSATYNLGGFVGSIIAFRYAAIKHTCRPPLIDGIEVSDMFSVDAEQS
jgi:hypothetical protein